MNKKHYNNVIDWTLKHDRAAQTEDSLATARAIFKNMGVALPNGSMQEVYDTIKTNKYMGWRSCTMQQAQQAADKGTAAIGISKDRVVILSATDEEEPVTATASVMTLSENTSAYAVAGLEYYAYGHVITYTVSVVSCSPQVWIDSSTVMGRDMAAAFGREGDYIVNTPQDRCAFESCWNTADKCVVVHTHGGSTELADEGSVTIISTDEIKNLSRNDRIHFVMMTACGTASGTENDNVAYWLSKRINPNGIVIANKYTVSGGDTDFCGVEEDRTPVAGWMVYKNGVVQDVDVPISLTMNTAYNIYLDLVYCSNV